VLWKSGGNARPALDGAMTDLTLAAYFNGPSPIGEVVSPGLYAGRIGEKVKIGYSLNLPRRTDAFRFEELIAVLPVSAPREPDEGATAYAFRVRNLLQQRERQIHDALATKRVTRGRRANADEWFRLDDEMLRVLFEHGAIVARARPQGRVFGTRTTGGPVKGFRARVARRTTPPYPPPRGGRERGEKGLDNTFN
jgi:hypothetical protein